LYKIWYLEYLNIIKEHIKFDHKMFILFKDDCPVAIQISVFIWELPFSIVNYLEDNLSKIINDLEPKFERVIFVWVNFV